VEEREMEGERVLYTLQTRRPEEYLQVLSEEPEKSNVKSIGFEGSQPNKEASDSRLEEYRSEERFTSLMIKAFITVEIWEGGISWAIHIADVPQEEGRIWNT
jgi:hypothetical protein